MSISKRYFRYFSWSWWRKQTLPLLYNIQQINRPTDRPTNQPASQPANQSQVISRVSDYESDLSCWRLADIRQDMLGRWYRPEETRRWHRRRKPSNISAPARLSGSSETQNAKYCQRLGAHTAMTLTGCIRVLRLFTKLQLSYAENGGSRIVRNLPIHSPNYKVSHSRRMSYW
jgi:hypothetical protein